MRGKAAARRKVTDLRFVSNCSGLLTTRDVLDKSALYLWFARVFVLRAWQPQAAMPAAQKDASRRRRRGIKHLNSYFCDMIELCGIMK